MPWQRLVHLLEAQLAAVDVARVNLACTVGLPGAERLDVQFCIDTLDRWAERVRQETERLAPRFHRDPASFDNSWARFRAIAMGSVLQRDCGACYRQELIDMDDAAFFQNAEHLFLHGVIHGRGGTCTSLPPIYLAVGRRLGYPLKLVHAKRHYFVRWDDPAGERFNIETTSRGVNIHSDDYYRQWPFPMSAEEERRHGYLRSLTRREELVSFLGVRSGCSIHQQRWREAVEALVRAAEMCPDDPGWSSTLVHAMNQWDRQLRGLMMLGFPSMTITFPPRRYSFLPRELEQGIIHMVVKENLLRNPEFDRAWWTPLRAGVRPAGLPVHLTVRYPQRGDEPLEVIPHQTIPESFYQSPRQPA